MIKKIIIELSGKQIEMTLEEAETLYTELKKIFDKPIQNWWIPWTPYTYPRVWYGTANTTETGNTTYTIPSDGK